MYPLSYVWFGLGVGFSAGVPWRSTKTSLLMPSKVFFAFTPKSNVSSSEHSACFSWAEVGTVEALLEYLESFRRFGKQFTCMDALVSSVGAQQHHRDNYLQNIIGSDNLEILACLIVGWRCFKMCVFLGFFRVNIANCSRMRPEPFSSPNKLSRPSSTQVIGIIFCFCFYFLITCVFCSGPARKVGPGRDRAFGEIPPEVPKLRRAFGYRPWTVHHQKGRLPLSSRFSLVPM